MSAMQQIADWLQKLGMSEYTQRFAENGIGFAALRHLTDQDLKDIGVLLGHRRIMLAAIQELGSPAVAGRVEAARHRRAPPSHGNVLRPCRLNGTLGAHGPRRPA